MYNEITRVSFTYTIVQENYRIDGLASGSAKFFAKIFSKETNIHVRDCIDRN